MGMRVSPLLVILCVNLGALSVLGSSVTNAPSPRIPPQKSPSVQSIRPGQQPSIQPGPTFTPKQDPSFFHRNRHGKLTALPPGKASHISSFSDHTTKAPHPHHAIRPSSIALAPSMSYVDPSVSTHTSHHHARIQPNTYLIPPQYSWKGPVVSPFYSPSPSSIGWNSLVPASAPTISGNHFKGFVHPPSVSPLASSFKKMKAPPPSHIMSLPPPPPNADCTSLTCTEPLTYTPAGSPCGCVLPIQVKLSLGVPIYTFFTLVTELAEEIAAGVALDHSQVRIMGANAASQQLEKSTILINLLPWVGNFNAATAFAIYKKFWKRQVLIKPTIFGAYEVIYVRYPGLPPSPPSSISGIDSVDGEPYTGRDNNGRIYKPLGVEIPRRKKDGLDRSMIAIILTSSFAALVMCMAIAWLFLLKCRAHIHEPQQVSTISVSSPEKSAGTTRPTTLGSMASSGLMSFSSGALTYTGSAKAFTLSDIRKATNDFDASRILGEGGFGVVYSGMLDDGREVAVKVLKRYDQHGGREFLAEVEMLSRLHHRNLVKLIGICTEDNARCLVYELIPNGSVESHLHGVHKETDPLDWDARMKIALGAARGLAYLHEDSSPRVIHRDFKSSNILLEHDFTPKVSDFGLARTAVDETNKHISTHVMGTFGYLAPEYAMTGHLLVKSDVYSYGVVLLELLTGRKPVGLSQPPGQENLVAYARPLLTIREGLDTIIDPAIRSSVPFDTISKVAAIASMCVQPEVSHRPFMGEVVQALKLVCNEFDETEAQEPRSRSHENLLINVDNKNSIISSDNENLQTDHTLPLSNSGLLSISVGLEGQELGSFQGHSTSEPQRTEKRTQFWKRLKTLS